MEVILLERIAKLGQIGDIVNVKNGYARNYLFPQKKALRVNEENKKIFEAQRVQLEARNLERKNEAEKISERLEGQSFTLIRSAGETGQLYGSVSARDIAEVMTENGFSINRSQIELHHPLKTIGIHNVAIELHAEVRTSIIVNIARSAEEAERQTTQEQKTNEQNSAEDINQENIEAAAENSEIAESASE